MDEESVKVLATITAKQAGYLTEEEVAILRSRKFYLSESERQAFASVLEEVVEETDTKKYPSKMNKAELLALATEKGIAVPDGASKEDVLALVK